jgi:hypothetical protein
VEKVERILFEFWDMEKPRLLLNIYGRKTYLEMKDDLEMTLINRIIDLALKSGRYFLSISFLSVLA